MNPSHLYIGTPLDNNRDMILKGRQRYPKGEESYAAKLTTEDVLRIRALHEQGVIQRRIAELFSVGFKAVNKIILRQRWKHV